MARMARHYAQYVGIVLVILGLLGLLMGEGPLMGILNMEPLVDVVRLVSGLALVFVGFRVADAGTVRAVAGAVGVLYLLLGLLGFVSTDLFELLQEELTVADDLIHLLVGVLGVAAAWLVGRRAVATT
jgi:Domain of unknown function (DUF4383)